MLVTGSATNRRCTNLSFFDGTLRFKRASVGGNQGNKHKNLLEAIRLGFVLPHSYPNRVQHTRLRAFYDKFRPGLDWRNRRIYNHLRLSLILSLARSGRRGREFESRRPD